MPLVMSAFGLAASGCRSADSRPAVDLAPPVYVEEAQTDAERPLSEDEKLIRPLAVDSGVED